MKLTLITIACMLFAGCSSNTNTFRKYLNEDNLPTQSFSINIQQDTAIVTTGGIIVQIPAGSLQSNTNPIQLEIKEALNVAEMLAGGLTTITSDGDVLSSAGMFYINASDGNAVRIIKPLQALVPSETYNANMKIWEGEKTDNGSIVWQSPTALPEDEVSNKISTGESLFKDNCASCHKVEKDFTGPALYGVTYKRTKKWLYDFTRNPAGRIAGTGSGIGEADSYADCLAEQWKPTVMTAFPALSDSALDAIYGYIKAETDKQPMPNNAYPMTCCDSCDLVKNDLKKYDAIQDKRTDLIQDNEEFFSLDRTITLAGMARSPVDTLPQADPEDAKEYVTSVRRKATYYTVNVSAFGWLNLDQFLKAYNDIEPSELFVNIPDNAGEDFNVSLIIPAYKVLVEGGKLKDGKSYGFDETNGKLPLPPGTSCSVIAFAEHKGKILFGKANFTAKASQKIDLKVRPCTKEELLAEIKKMGLPGDVKIDVKDSRHTDEIRKADKETERLLDSIQKKRPKNCDCIDFPVKREAPMASFDRISLNGKYQV